MRGFRFAAALAVAWGIGCNAGGAAENGGGAKALADAAVGSVMKEYDIPGMAVGILTPDGEPHAFFYGVASRTTRKPVTADTLFEIGSVSKTFTATLGAYGEATGQLSLTESATKYLTRFRGTALDGVTLRDLGTHLSGGLPLQVPEDVRTQKDLDAYLAKWMPASKPGTVRTYSNVGIGLFGMAVADAMGGDFGTLMEERLFRGLGLTHSFVTVPKGEDANYAQGYTKKNAPTRMLAGVLGAEAYGIRSTLGDLTRFVAINMGLETPADPALAKAVAATHTGYARVRPMTQDLVWEQYDWPATLSDLLAGNADKMAYEANEAEPIVPPSPPRGDVLINKTGSTNGFATYVAYLPERRIGVVLMANRNYPIPARVKAAYAILTGLEGKGG